MPSDDPTNPPSGSCMKLVLMPAAFVLGGVLLVLGVRWMTVGYDDVHSLVDTLERDGHGRWRAAADLAAALNHPDNQNLKRDRLLATRLTDILRRELEAGPTDNNHLRLQAYLCRALGEFQVAEPLDVLRQAVAGERSDDVRRSAIEAIAVLASNLGVQQTQRDEPVMTALREAADDRNGTIRATTAFTLGVIGGPEAEALLEISLDDADADVRYNAACGLARSGNAAAVDVLLEMLDSQRSVSVKVNALESVRQLAAANRTFDVGRVETTVRKLSDSDVDPAVREKAAAVLDSSTRGASRRTLLPAD